MAISAPVMNYVVDPLERAARTFIQQFVVVLMTASTAGLLVTQHWAVAADSALFAAIISLITSVITFRVPTLPSQLDLALRVVKTFLQSFLGTLAASQVASVSHADWKGALAVAVPVAVTSLLTGLLAIALPGTTGASFLPAGVAVAVDDGSSPEVDVDAAALAPTAPSTLDSLKASDPPTGPKHAA